MADSAASPKSKTGIWQWFWRGRALALARSELHGLPAAQRAALTRARTALELGDVALDPIDAPRSGPALPFAAPLYREAAFYALIALQPESSTSELRQALEAVSERTLAFAAGGAEPLEQIKQLLLTRSFREPGPELPELQRADARALRAFAAALIELQLGPERRVGRLGVQRFVRLSLACVLLITLFWAGSAVYSAFVQGPDLAAGKPWHPSTAFPGIAPQVNNFLFHTQEEDSPYVEIDLLAPQQFSVVDVINRRDCCQDRALPTLIEISKDKKRWKEVARRNESYSEWHAKFAPVTARYVRIRVAHRTLFHLAGFAVRAH